MRVKYLVLINCLLFIFTSISCQKVNERNISSKEVNFANSNGKMVNNFNDKQIVIDWLYLHDQNLKSKEKKILEELIIGLNFNAMCVGKRNNGESIVTIPINNSIRKDLNSKSSHLNLSEKSILNLIIIQNTSGKLRWASIISFLPKRLKITNELSIETIQNLINGEKVLNDGIYKFIDIKGKLQYIIEYKDKRLFSFSRSLKGKNAKTSENATSSLNCIDWILETTIYYSDGSTEHSSEYQFTTCEDDTEQNGDGGSGGGNNDFEPVYPEDPNDHEITISGSFETYETDLVDEDFKLPSDTEIEYDSDGGAITPTSFASSLIYNHSWNYPKHYWTNLD